MDVATFRAMLSAAKAAPGLEALTVFACLCVSFAREAQKEIDHRIGVAAAVQAEDRWLTPKEAAPLLGISPKSLHRRWRTLPFCRPGVTKGFRVSLTGLRAYMECDTRESVTRPEMKRHASR